MKNDSIKSAIFPMIIFLMLILMAGLGNHFIDGMGV